MIKIDKERSIGQRRFSRVAQSLRLALKKSEPAITSVYHTVSIQNRMPRKVGCANREVKGWESKTTNRANNTNCFKKQIFVF